MIDIMIDIETLGVSSRAPMFEIGAVKFNIEDGSVYDEFHTHIDILDVIISTGFLPEKGAVEFWNSQNKKPKLKGRVALANALNDLRDFLHDDQFSRVWANSPQFDLSLIKAHWEFGKPDYEFDLWTYKQESDLRTMKVINRMIGNDDPESKLIYDHNALNDCLNQVDILCKIYTTLRR